MDTGPGVNTNTIDQTLVAHDGTRVQNTDMCTQQRQKHCLTTSEVYKDVIFCHFCMFHNFTHKFERSLAIHLRK
jgi:hypothetical protein